MIFSQDNLLDLVVSCRKRVTVQGNELAVPFSARAMLVFGLPNLTVICFCAVLTFALAWISEFFLLR